MSQQDAPGAFQRLNAFVTGFFAPASIRVDQGDIPFALQPFAASSAGVSSSGNPVAIAGGGNGQVSFQIPNDQQLEVDDWRATSSAISSSTQPGAPLGFLVDISWNGNQNKLTPNPLPGEFVFSTSAMYRGNWSPRPWIVTWMAQGRMPDGRVMPQQSFSNLQFSITNTLTTTNTIYFALMGWRRARAGV